MKTETVALLDQVLPLAGLSNPVGYLPWEIGNRKVDLALSFLLSLFLFSVYSTPLVCEDLKHGCSASRNDLCTLTSFI